MFEVELKFPVKSLSDVRSDLLHLQATIINQKTQVDEYFDDPLRDFASLDYALRIRSVDGKHRLTFKGPNLDQTAKMRHEVDLPMVDESSADRMRQVFKGIGFTSVARVEKSRETMKLTWRGTTIEVCLDRVVKLGDFVELEIVVASKEDAETAKQILLSLARELDLANPTTTSYLTLLMQQGQMID